MTGPDVATKSRTVELFQEAQSNVHRHTDRLFANLMIIQWLAGIVAALVVSPRTWIGTDSQTHLHVWVAIFLGGAITGFPVFLAWKKPGDVLTRHTIAVAQMLYSALLIHLTGGRVETHFHVFGSLAFLAIYRDWRVLVSATVVIGIDHFARGLFWPQSVFGIATASHWRWLEHVGWVAFEDAFLLVSTRQSLRDMYEVASRRAVLETNNARIEQLVTERTAELVATHQELRGSEDRFASAFEHASIGMALVSPEGHWLKVNRALCELLGYTPEELFTQTFQDITHPDDLDIDLAHMQSVIDGKAPSYQMQKRYLDKEGRLVWVLLSVSLVRDADGKPLHFISQIQDITERRRAEASLDAVQGELIEASRRAGMAEVATSVLHNIGNVLNSVNISCAMVSTKVRNSRVGSVMKTAELLDEHSTDLAGFFANDPRGPQLPGFLRKLAARLEEEQSSVIAELQLLEKNIDHIKEVVAMQQSYSKGSGVTEIVNVADLLDDSLRMNGDALARHRVEVIREYSKVPPITVEKHKAVQILVNLIRNAKQACDESLRKDKSMTVRLTGTEKGARIEIIDNGIGIARENLTRIFEHGYTTKPQGHGFGLHSGAIAARELGGSLTVHSEGTEQGATFILELPLAPNS
ncbi:PAS domain S-box protein [Luteolibacter yonseiensis]|uniref:histidine kinase n=1 Tax=Luteolibacter yonseiensis TaxID=1144680 RepID=A0A934VBB9_9BACT|nr:HAMP domain-containing sensor histidine kinase [Luteolibacter yonseiensis]MBK1817103.1 PAS domain S-box protein [Luteolibacter yonseiensis]